MRTVCSLLILMLATGASRADDWQPLFNGKDLTGWRANNDPESFKGQDGVLRLQALGKFKAHLFYVGERSEGFESFKNFELEATVRAEPNSNGGIFVHTDMSTRDAAKHLAKGYEVQLNSSTSEKRKTGSLYAIVDQATSELRTIALSELEDLQNGSPVKEQKLRDLSEALKKVASHGGIKL